MEKGCVEARQSWAWFNPTDHQIRSQFTKQPLTIITKTFVQITPVYFKRAIVIKNVEKEEGQKEAIRLYITGD